MIDLAAAAAVPAIVMRVAQRTQETERAVVGLRVRRVFDVHVGPQSRHEDLQLAAVEENAAIVRVRVLSYTINGKEADANTKTQTANRWQHPQPGDLLDRPFDPRYVQDYSYEIVDSHTIRFSSTIHDAAHGSGTFTIDAQDDVTSYQYSPYVYPQYATRGTVTDTRSEVLPNYWALTQEVYQYRGHYAIFGGSSTTTVTYNNFQRFIDVNTAIAALDAGRI